MIKILANDGIAKDGKALLEKAGFQVDTDKLSQEELLTKLNDYDAIIVRSATKVTKELMDAAPNLKIVARAGVGLDNIDMAYAKTKNIKVVNTPAASSQSVAELAFAHILSLSRFLHRSHKVMPEKGDYEFKQLKKTYSGGTQLRGKTLGIIGFGRIGKASARMGLALGMKVIAHDPYVNAAQIDINIFDSDKVALTVKMKTDSLEHLIKNSDYITLHVPGDDKPLIGKSEISQMKDGVVLINTARGGAIDEDALLDGLNSGKVGGAGLDVFKDEPKPRKDLLHHEKVSLSPHIGASTEQAQENIGLELANKLIHFFEVENKG